MEAEPTLLITQFESAASLRQACEGWVVSARRSVQGPIPSDLAWIPVLRCALLASASLLRAPPAAPSPSHSAPPPPPLPLQDSLTRQAFGKGPPDLCLIFASPKP